MDFHSAWQWIVAACVASIPLVKKYGWPAMKKVVEFITQQKRIADALEGKKGEGELPPLEMLKDIHSNVTDLRGRIGRVEDDTQELRKDFRNLNKDMAQVDRRLKLVERPNGRIINES